MRVLCTYVFVGFCEVAPFWGENSRMPGIAGISVALAVRFGTCRGRTPVDLSGLGLERLGRADSL